jgi:hypothetical protein
MSGAAIALTMWTDDPALARTADAAGIDRIGVDLETLGKRSRQAGIETWVSPHSLDDLERVAATVHRGAVFARLNPLHPRFEPELEATVALGAEVVMLPMFRSAAEVRKCSRLLAGRASLVGLLETPEALSEIEAIVQVPGLEEIHIGINDLGLALRLRSRFEVLALDEVAHVAAVVHAAGLRFGLGGIGRAQEAGPLVPTDLVYAQLARLRADSTLLSRSFLREPDRLKADVKAARERLTWWFAQSDGDLESARQELLDGLGGPEQRF